MQGSPLIALLGDTHMPRGVRGLPGGCLRLLQESSLILHTGDLTSREFLAELEGLGPVAAVRGNMDEPPLRSILPERLEIEAEGIRMAIVHDGGSKAGRRGPSPNLVSRTATRSRTATATCPR